jgi:hypothetical protein
MMVLALIGLFAAAGAVLFGIDAFTISVRPNATVLQQAVAYLGLGFSSIVMTLCIGFWIMADRLDRSNKRG